MLLVLSMAPLPLTWESEVAAPPTEHDLAALAMMLCSPVAASAVNCDR